MFIHWGLYSIPGGIWEGRQIGGYSEQIQAHAHIPREEYEKLAGQFNPTNWDPDAVARLAIEAGMKFIVLTSKHHDGFSLFKTEQSTFNVVDASPYGIDIVKGLAEACARHGLSFGVYFSMIDWHFEGGTGIDYAPNGEVRNDNEIPASHAQFNAEQLKELLSGYGPISEVWFDMGSPTPEQSILFTDTVHALQPNTMVSGRVFNHEGDFTVMGDNEIPPYLLEEPWQSPASIYHETWGYRTWQDRSDLGAKVGEHLRNLVRVVSRGGNYLLNIGPKGDGSLVAFEAKVLSEIGVWLSQHREAFDGCQPQPFRHLEFGCCTTVDATIYLFVSKWPEDGRLLLPGLTNVILKAEPIGWTGDVRVSAKNEGGQEILVTTKPHDSLLPVLRLELSGLPHVLLPAIPPNAAGEYRLLAKQADVLYRTNGRGYYDPPKPYALTWVLDGSLTGKWSLEVELEDRTAAGPLEWIIAGEALQTNLPEDISFDLHFRPGESSEAKQTSIRLQAPESGMRGAHLASVPNSIRLKPIP